MSIWKDKSIRSATDKDLKPYREFIGDDGILNSWVVDNTFIVVQYVHSDILYVYSDGKYQGWGNWDDNLGTSIKKFQLTQDLITKHGLDPNKASETASTLSKI